MYSVCLVDYNADPTASTQVPVNKELYIYDSLGTDDGLAVTEPTLTLTANSAGEFSCIIPETNYGYGRIITHRTRVVVRKNEKVIFIGRINEENRDLYLNEEIKAEGSLTVLNDTLTEKKTFTYVSLPYLLNYIFTNHNSKFSDDENWKKFNFPYDSATDKSTNCAVGFVGRDDKDVNSDKISYYSVNFHSTMDVLQELLSLANAVIKLDFNETSGMWDVYIYDKNNLPATSNQPIEFGVNLLDLVQSYDKTDICSYVAPFGGDAIQEDKSIGEAIAGSGISGDWTTWYDSSCWVRPKDNPAGAYERVAAAYGYWVFELDINAYNAVNPNNKLKQLYVSWRGHYLEPEENKCEDCAWRVYDTSGDSIGYRKFDTGPGFDSAINEVIDLTSAEFYGAAKVVVSGWGALIRPLIKRDATVVEESDKLNISKCDVMGSSDDDDLVHTAGSFYLYSKSLVKSFGRIEKKLEYDIEDKTIPCTDPDGVYTNWSYYKDANGVHYKNYNSQTHNAVYYDDESKLGKGTFYDGQVLCYNAGDGTDLESNKGNYEIKPFSSPGSGYGAIEYILPDPGSANYPRGVFISCRMHTYGVWEYTDPDSNVWHYQVDGMYAIFDTSGQVLAYKSAEKDMYTSVMNEYIDLSDPKYFGAKMIRVGGWGGDIPVNAVPSDDAYSRNRLMAQAQLYLTSEQWEKVTIEATAVDLSMTSDEWDSLDVCTKAEVVSSFHGITPTYFPITSLTLRLDRYEDNTIRLGYDNDEYLSNQLSENLRLMSVEQTIEERRNKS